MRKIHQFWKILVIGFLMLVHALAGTLAALFLSGSRLRSYRLHLAQRNSRIAITVLGIEIEIVDELNWRQGQTYLVVANHLSYLDILVLANFKPLVFVSTVEVKNTPVLGKLAASAGSIFVERRSRENIQSEIGVIESTLREGFSLAFFPEATSTNGSSVLPFKRPFFAPAQLTQLPVLPLVIQPIEIDGKKIQTSNRDLYCWYGDMTFFPHLFAIAGCERIKIRLKILPEIATNENTNRDELARSAQTAIATQFQPIL